MRATAGPGRNRATASSPVAAPSTSTAPSTNTAPSTSTVLCAGLATLDIIQLVERVPAANEKVVARNFVMAAGGPAANAAVAAAACGARATLATALPEHDLIGLIVADLARCGVDVVRAAAYGGPPITASILVTAATGERAVVSPSGAATVGTPEATGAAASLDGVGAVLIDGYFPTVTLPLARAARERGIPVLLDGGSHKPHTDAVVREVDLAVVSDDFAPPGTDASPSQVFDYLASLGVTRAVITRGDRPVLYRTPASAGEVGVTPVSPVLDTLGAGDFFHGALATRVAALGLNDARLPADLEFAAAVVAKSLGSFGTRAWLSAGSEDHPGR
ncbi:PfkB family carbohydrate kinase [Demequina pelophila]|uniref:PfkB family carbohydrate kinase n=1 Tax=Demequina pelophila TaxID=1638984 RepID=UPI00138E2BD1|nr:PfkB family carbohydrate kinase [Demequina pelophila]